MGAIMKRMFRNTIMPGTLWEELGLLYMGPVDGHNIAELEEILARRRDSHSGPAIIHVVTKKGKGYRPAEANAVHFHGIAPSCKKDAPQEECTFSGIFAESLMDLMERNEKIVAVTAAMTDGTGLAPVARKFPDRVFDVGICEQHAVTMAAGIATQGFIPVVAIYSTFLQRAYDQIIHDVCIQGLPVIFAIDRAGVVGDDGKTHQGIFDISFLRTAPGLTLCAPMDGAELRDMLGTAVAARTLRYQNPEHRGPAERLHAPGRRECGRADCAILASADGRTVPAAADSNNAESTARWRTCATSPPDGDHPRSGRFHGDDRYGRRKRVSGGSGARCSNFSTVKACAACEDRCAAGRLHRARPRALMREVGPRRRRDRAGDMVLFGHPPERRNKNGAWR